MPNIVGTGQMTLVDMNDVLVSATKPLSPVEGQLWWNTTEAQLYVYQNGDWQKSSNVLVGGRNLLRYSGLFMTTNGWTTNNGGTNLKVETKDGFPCLSATGSVKGTVSVPVNNGKEYVYSTEIMFNANVELTSSTPLHEWIAVSGLTGQTGIDGFISIDGGQRTLVANKWHKIILRFKIKDDGNAYLFTPFIYKNPMTETWWMKNIQLTEGNIPLDWSPAPEDAHEVIVDITETLGNMANDNLLDYNERQVIKEKVEQLIGISTTDTGILPAIGTLDSSSKGLIFTVRRQAIQVGVPSTHIKYTTVESTYTALKNYLEGLKDTSNATLRPWDISIANQDKVITVTKATFRTNWLNLYNALNDLAIYTSQVTSDESYNPVKVNYASNGDFEIPLSDGLWKDSYVGQTKGKVDISAESAPFKSAYHVKNTTNANGGIFLPVLWSGASAEKLVDREVTVQFWLKYQNIVAGAQSYLAGRFGELLIEGENDSAQKFYRYIRFANPTTMNEGSYITGTDMTWKKYVGTTKLTLPTNATKITKVSFKHGLEGCTGEFWTTGIKVEFGSKATDWSVSPFDLEQKIYKTELAVQPDNITATVTSHQTFTSKVGENIDKATSNESAYINKNYNFADWTGTYPVGFEGNVGTAVSKVASENGNGKSAKFTNALGVESYLSGVGYLNKPYYNYVYVESTFKLESGSINGAGILFRYLRADNSSSAFEGRFKFSDVVSSPTLNKWYTVSTVFKVPVPTDFGGYRLYAMGSYGSFDSTKPAKTIYIDSVISRPASSEEIKAYEANISVADMMADDKITPLEKHTLKNELDMIVAEKPTFEAKANQYAVTTEKDDYITAYNALYSALSPHLSNLNTTATGVNGTAIRTLFKDYNDKKTILERAILNAVQFGGRNLLRNSNFAKYTTNDSLAWDKNLNGNIVADGYWSNGYNAGVKPFPTQGYHAHLNIEKFGYPVIEFIDKNSNLVDTSVTPNITGLHRWQGLSNTMLLTDPFCQSLAVGKTYTVSLEAMSDTVGMRVNVGFHHFETGNATQGFFGYQWNLQACETINVWERKYQTFTINNKWDLTKALAFYVYGYLSTMEGSMWVRNIKIEEGTRYTDWSETPEDTNSFMYNLADRVSSAEEKITDSAIINTVTQSTSYKNDLGTKANAEDLNKYATTGQLDQAKQDANKYADDQVKNIDFTPFVVKSEMTQTINDITTKFQAGGGVNLLKNSVGYADFSFWTQVSPTYMRTVGNNALDALGFGKGFYFFPSAGASHIKQDVYVTAGQPYTLSWYMNKTNASPAKNADGTINNDGVMWVQILEGATTLASYKYNSEVTTKGFEKNSYVYTPKSNVVTIRIYAEKLADATVSGLMFNIGDSPLQWSMATGEIYNTNIRMDMNGIRVSQTVNGVDRGYTQITPDEFAGYYDTDGDGVYEKVFYLQEDETVSKKFTAKEEFTMGGIKIIKIESTSNKGWAFVQNLD
ncbi:minor head protein [Bacillus phage vB_BanS_MrDarsey]|uniref:Tail fiber n=1 Tax=Bacillus phage vB_BanS_MrDarsey TaxID=2894787 RepID=A0AAE8YQF0_9CAUD|nr:minor head protein [Bacillus phage vB_BanS_MrDarsey]UGO48025.1 tail fiber [Bacillus phage vB_BanS_MrDarsey]